MWSRRRTNILRRAAWYGFRRVLTVMIDVAPSAPLSAPFTAKAVLCCPIPGPGQRAAVAASGISAWLDQFGRGLEQRTSRLCRDARDALFHLAQLCATTDLAPVNADFESGFADARRRCHHVALAIQTALRGFPSKTAAGWRRPV